MTSTGGPYKADDPRIHEFFLDLHHQQGRDESISVEYARQVETFGKFLEPQYRGGEFRLLVDATESQVLGFLDHMKRVKRYKPRTINRKIYMLRSFYQKQIRDGRLRDDPTKGVPLPEIGERAEKRLPPEAIERIFATCKAMPGRGVAPKRDLAVLHLLATGLRKNEISRLRLRSFDRQAGTVTVGKGKYERVVPLEKAAVDAIVAYLEVRPKTAKGDSLFCGPRGPVTQRNIWYRVQMIGKAAKLAEPLSPDSIRVSVAVNTLMRDPSKIYDVKLAFGHRSMANTESLAQMAAELRRAEEAEVGFVGPNPETLEALKLQRVRSLWLKAKERLSDDQDGAVTLTRSLLESVAKTVLKGCGESCSDSDKLSSLCKRAIAAVLPSQVLGQEYFPRFAQSAANLVEHIRDYRNDVGDAHGDEEMKAIERHHAEYAVSLAGATAAFIVECYQTHRSKSPR